MKRFCLFLILIFGLSFGLVAQGKPDDGKRQKMFKEIQEFKMKYLAQEMNLNEEQKPKFVELYSEMTKQREKCFKEVWQLERKLKKNKNASEEEYQQLTDLRNKANIEFAEIEKSYDEKFAEFLTPKQIFEMKEGEKNFREKLDEMRRDKKKRP